MADRRYALIGHLHDDYALVGHVHGGGIADGTTTNAMLRWNGTAWVENANTRAVSGNDGKIEVYSSGHKGDLFQNSTDLTLRNSAATNSNLILAADTVEWRDKSAPNTLLRFNKSGAAPFIQSYGRLALIADGSWAGEGSLFIQEKAAAWTDSATYGQFWVRNDAPNTPMFTDDTGVDHVLNDGGGLADGTVTGVGLIWNGTAWVQGDALTTEVLKFNWTGTDVRGTMELTSDGGGTSISMISNADESGSSASRYPYIDMLYKVIGDDPRLTIGMNVAAGQDAIGATFLGSTATTWGINAKGSSAIGLELGCDKVNIYMDNVKIEYPSWMNQAKYLRQTSSSLGNIFDWIFTGHTQWYITGIPSIRHDGVLFLEEQTAAEADGATYGQIWVKNDVPNTLWFTDDAGTDFPLINANFVESNVAETITGAWTFQNDVTFDTTADHLRFPLDDDAVTPTIGFGATDYGTGFFLHIEDAGGDILGIAADGVYAWGIGHDLIQGALAGGGPRIDNEVPSATNPVFLPNRTDGDTGIGQNAVDQISMIAGAAEIGRWSSTGLAITGELSATKSGGGAADYLHLRDSTDATDLVFRYDGTDWYMRSELAGAGNRYAWFVQSSGAVILFHGNNANFNTAAAGIDIRGSLGNDPTTGGVQNAQLNFENSSGTEIGDILWQSNVNMYMRNLVHGGNVQLQGQKATGGTTNNLFVGDPDGSAGLYYDGELLAETNDFFGVHTFDQRADINTATPPTTETPGVAWRQMDLSGGDILSEMGFFGVNYFTIQNRMHGSEIYMRVEDSGGTVRIPFRVGSASSASAVGFHNTAPIVKPTVTGSRGGNAALASLLTALANYGLITDSST